MLVAPCASAWTRPAAAGLCRFHAGRRCLADRPRCRPGRRRRDATRTRGPWARRPPSDRDEEDLAAFHGADVQLGVTPGPQRSPAQVDRTAGRSRGSSHDARPQSPRHRRDLRGESRTPLTISARSGRLVPPDLHRLATQTVPRAGVEQPSAAPSAGSVLDHDVVILLVLGPGPGAGSAPGWRALEFEQLEAVPAPSARSSTRRHSPTATPTKTRAATASTTATICDI